VIHLDIWQFVFKHGFARHLRLPLSDGNGRTQKSERSGYRFSTAGQILHSS
jgi:hypothetical protein